MKLTYATRSTHTAAQAAIVLPTCCRETGRRREGAEVDRRDDMGQTPLAAAAWNGHRAVVAFLADFKDVDINSRDNLGRTPLFLAMQSRSIGDAIWGTFQAVLGEDGKRAARLSATDALGHVSSRLDGIHTTLPRVVRYPNKHYYPRISVYASPSISIYASPPSRC